MKIDEGTTTTGTADIVRLIMYIDKQTNGAQAAVTDILEASDILSFRNLANTNRFTVLCDKVVTMNIPAGSGNGTTYKHPSMERWVNIYKKVNVPIEYSGVTGVITEIESNNIGILMITANSTIDINSRVRCRFTG